MKKIFLSLLFFPGFYLFSAPNGNPSEPAIIQEGFMIPDTKWYNFRVQYQVYDGEDLLMKFKSDVRDSGFVLRKLKAFSNSGILTFNIKERLDIYAEIASFYLEPEFRQSSNLYVSKSETDFLYRGGFKVVFFEILKFTLGGDVKYSYFSAPASFLTQNDVPQNDNNLKFTLKQWQIGLGVSQKIALLRPYLGIAYDGTSMRIENFSFFQNRPMGLKFQKKAGMFLGASLSMGSFIMLNAEIRMVNERSTTFSGQIRF